MDVSAAHLLSMPHFWWGLALAALAAALMLVGRDAPLRRRLRFTLVVTVAFIVFHIARVASPALAAAPHQGLFDSLESMLLALAVTNTVVTLVFNPWVRRPERDRAPAIVQDVVVVGLIGGVAYYVFGQAIVGPSLGAAAAVALGLQDQLGNLFAGLAIQIERPFRVGHWVALTGFEGRVVEVTWRATKLRTKTGNLVVLPNSMMGREAITNYSEPAAPTRQFVEVGATYLAAPNDVREALLAAMARVPRVLQEPPPAALVSDFGASAIVYRAWFWILEFEQDWVICHEVRTAIYYEFKRRGIEIPWPIQVEYHREDPPRDIEGERQGLARTIAGAAVLATLPADAHRALAEAAKERLFADGEAIVQEGEPGASMFIVRRGLVAVTVGADHREVATIDAGGYFGEMSLLTGDPRTATVVARGDSTVIELTADAFRAYVRSRPEVIDQLAEAATSRRRSLDEARAAASVHAVEPRSLAHRMRQFFGLK
ncbi:MAG: cyclic nucleotide-binding domain-containing protein [Vicinamibacterales bacterium]